jgi:hypothetical protein
MIATSCLLYTLRLFKTILHFAFALLQPVGMSSLTALASAPCQIGLYMLDIN